MGYPAKAVANYLLANNKKIIITPLKIQKLVYIAHGWHLAYFDNPLVSDEEPEAWPHGPVFPSLYHAFKHRGRLPIIELATEYNFEKREYSTPNIPKTDKTTCKFLDKVMKVYGNFTGTYLSLLTHREPSPWSDTRKESGGLKNVNIKNKYIQRYYEGLKGSGTGGSNV